MGALDRIRDVFARFVGPARPQDRYVYVHDAAVRVDEVTAMTVAAVFACVRYIAESIGALPWHAYERRGKSRVARPDDPIDWVLGVRPNPETSAMAWREKMLADALLFGGGFAELVFDGAGRITASWQLDAQDVEVTRNDDGVLVYRVRGGGSRVPIPAEYMYHLHGLGYDGITGMSVLQCGARDIGIALAQSKYASATYRNGSRPSVVVETDQQLRQDQIDMYRSQIEAVHKGADNAAKAAILGNGMKLRPLSLSPADLQLIESQKFSVEQVARWFRVPPHKVGALDRATWGNIEHQAIEAVTDCLLPWCVRLEQEAHAKLIGRNNQSRVYTRLNLAGLLRGDLKTRYDAYAVGRLNGWLSSNDIRELEDMNPIAGGDQYLVQSQMVPLDKLAELVQAQIDRANEPPPAPAPGPNETPANYLARVLNLSRSVNHG